MWDGNRHGPRGGKPFRGNHRGEMFGGRDGPMQDFRNRDGMNMGPMGPMGPMMGPTGPRPQDRPPMDMRSDGPPDMRGRDMEPLAIRGREPNRDFFRPGDEPDFSLRRQYEIVIRDKLMNAPGFMGPGRNNMEMGGRGMEQREPNDRLMDMRDREMFRNKMPGFSHSNQDARRGFPMGPMGRNDGFRDMRDRDRPPMGMDDLDGFNMDMGQRDRGMMGLDRRGGPPFNRGGFDSDMDFRNRMGSPADFRGRDRSPLRFGENDGAPMDVRGRPDHHSGPNRSKFGEDGNMRDRARENSPIDYRGGEEMTLAEEWKNRRARERDSVPAAMSRSISPFPRDGMEPGFPSSMGRDGNKAAHIKERDRPPTDFPGKEVGGFGGFPRPDPKHPGPPNWEKNAPTAPLPGVGLLPLGLKGPHDPPFPTMGPLSNPHRENDGKRWPGDRDPKQNQNVHRDDRPPFHQEKNQPSQQAHGPADLDCFKGPKDPAGPERPKMGPGPEFQSNSGEQRRDQDYRDIDYRTGSGRAFEYKREDLQGPEKILKESKPVPLSKFSDSGSQDQDYRSASVKDKVSHTISITGIPKTATMEQILGAFAVRDGVPMQGMKIKNVVPGYSYDTAYVEFFNLDDAVHFMESNQGSLKVGTKVASMRYVQPDRNAKDAQEPGLKAPPGQEPLLPGLLPDKAKNSQETPQAKGPVEPAGPVDPLTQGQWQRSSDLTPEAWQQQVDQQLRQKEAEQQAESWASRNAPRHGPHQTDPIFKESKTMILKNVKPTTTVETILKALDPFAYLDERNVRLVKGKPPGAKCFCFVDMDSHEQVTRLVDLLTKPRPLSIDGDRVYAEVAKPLKNQMYKRDSDKSNTSLLGYPPETSMLEQQQHYFPQGLQPAVIQGDLMGSLAGSSDPSLSSGSHMAPSLASYGEAPPMDPSFQALGPHVSAAASGLPGTTGSEAYSYATETPDMTDYLYDATSGFYYDPQTTLYYDPSSRYFYNAQTQEYLFWDSVSKTYIPVPGGTSDPQTPMGQPVTMAADVQAILANPAADAPLEMKKPSELQPVPDPGSAPDSVPVSDPAASLNLERRDEDDASHSDKKDKDEKPRSLAAFKIMKDMERWAKIQNRQKDSVRAPSPVLKGGPDDRKASKAADAAFAIFERKGSGGDDLFKKPFAPPTKKDEKSSKRPMGSLGLLASDYAAGSDEEEEEKHDAPRAPKSQSEEREDKLTDWKKMACLLCRRQFPNKDALMRHQQLSDLHKQNMEIHLKIKRSKKELEALENQEKELSARESTRSPEPKKRKHQHHQHQNTWAGGSRDSHKGSERPGLGSEPVERKKKEAVVWDHATYKQAVRKAMFARFKELD
ncbi:RNA-binding protein 6 [Hypomesus transpacificus]|uniref:RNA-binding protein 6 n=1 Tax=Hypomesus transpacificus TaxID=137520 RepID=UPI001F085B5F|nr:RNA-binding protein 6 [Hypomesus transpacificus]XP_046880999.1 RNA-binding protein 6 [Hypomesus transpacificus]